MGDAHPSMSIDHVFEIRAGTIPTNSRLRPGTCRRMLEEQRLALPHIRASLNLTGIEVLPLYHFGSGG
jgi:hypothetical protein